MSTGIRYYAWKLYKICRHSLKFPRDSTKPKEALI